MYSYVFVHTDASDGESAHEEPSGPSRDCALAVSPYLERPLRSLEQVLLSRATAGRRD
ncbi:MAG: hypothetical protein ACFCUQ_22090 [Kiloniellales bacterium]